MTNVSVYDVILPELSSVNQQKKFYKIINKMNLLQPVSTIMHTNLITVAPKDELTVVKQLFDEHNIHHLPVVRYQEIVGMISKNDFSHYLHGFTHNAADSLLEEVRLRAWKAEDIMTSKLAKIESKDPISLAIDLFKLNRFHALPVVDDKKLVGILTTYDIIEAISTEPVKLTDYQSAK